MDYKEDCHSDCSGILGNAISGQIDMMKQIIKPHIKNYVPATLTRDMDSVFGQTKLTDCAHRIAKRANGITVY